MNPPPGLDVLLEARKLAMEELDAITGEGEMAEEDRSWCRMKILAYEKAAREIHGWEPESR